jgi:hypothetical protein
MKYGVGLLWEREDSNRNFAGFFTIAVEHNIRMQSGPGVPVRLEVMNSVNKKRAGR